MGESSASTFPENLGESSALAFPEDLGESPGEPLLTDSTATLSATLLVSSSMNVTCATAVCPLEGGLRIDDDTVLCMRPCFCPE